METTGRPEESQLLSEQRVDPQYGFRALLLPVKDLRNAKQRLAAVLTPDERFGLAQAMLADTIQAVCGVHRANRIFVVTNYEPAMETAAKFGWEVLREEHQVSESASVDLASRLCSERGVTALLRLPLDLPLVQPAVPRPLSWFPRVTALAPTRFFARRQRFSLRTLGQIVSPSIAAKRSASARGPSFGEMRGSKWTWTTKPISAHFCTMT
jgi:hypothetical protein